MENLNILVLDDESRITQKLCKLLADKDYTTYPAFNSKQALSILAEHKIDIAIVDVVLPDENGLNFIAKIRKISTDIEVIAMSGHGTMDMVIDAMHKDVVDFVRKPFSFDEIHSAIERTNKYLNLQHSVTHAENKYSLISRELEEKINMIFVGKSESIRSVIRLAITVGTDRDANVLITGENGTGKEIIARIIHHSSDRKNNQIFTVNCSAIPETLLESEFFGHRKGAFTDAKENKRGFFELAHGGSLFLDEIADMPLRLQAKLLRAIEEKKIKQIGNEKEIDVDIRIISATNKNISEQIENNNFRLDLYHRINTFVIPIPPLRERLDDIEPLLKYFIKYFARKKKKPVPKINKKTINILKKYDFPGNVRELRNMVERAVILSTEQYLDISDFTLVFDDNHSPEGKKNLNIENQEMDLIQKALQSTKYNQNQAAILLGISRDALIRRMKKYQIKISKNF